MRPHWSLVRQHGRQLSRWQHSSPSTPWHHYRYLQYIYKIDSWPGGSTCSVPSTPWHHYRYVASSWPGGSTVHHQHPGTITGIWQTADQVAAQFTINTLAPLQVHDIQLTRWQHSSPSTFWHHYRYMIYSWPLTRWQHSSPSILRLQEQDFVLFWETLQ